MSDKFYVRPSSQMLKNTIEFALIQRGLRLPKNRSYTFTENKDYVMSYDFDHTTHRFWFCSCNVGKFLIEMCYFDQLKDSTPVAVAVKIYKYTNRHDLANTWIKLSFELRSTSGFGSLMALYYIYKAAIRSNVATALSKLGNDFVKNYLSMIEDTYPIVQYNTPDESFVFSWNPTSKDDNALKVYGSTSTNINRIKCANPQRAKTTDHIVKFSRTRSGWYSESFKRLQHED